MNNQDAFLNLLENRRVIVCMGPGGVGKTTISASLALQAASMGRRVHCLTIDPSGRLAQATGIEAWPEDGTVDLTERAASEVGITSGGRLELSMVKPAKIFDDIISRFSESERDSGAVLSNPLYRHLFLNLPGMTDYMAMEKIGELKADDSFDLIVIDTSPAAQTLEFFGAPRKMDGYFNGSAARLVARWNDYLEVKKKTRHYLGMAIKGLSLLAGRETFEMIMNLIDDCSELFSFLHENARMLEKQLRKEDVSCLLLTSPVPQRITEAISVLEKTAQLELNLDGFIFNRVHPPPPAEEPDLESLAGCIAECGVNMDRATELAHKLSSLRDDRKDRVEKEQLAIGAMVNAREASHMPSVQIPMLELDVGDFRSLRTIAGHITGK